MKSRRLGNSDLHITPIGLGTWAMGGARSKLGWGPQDDRDSIAAIHAALDCGINWIDTAAVYGLGHAEELIAKALRGMSKRPYLFSKCGMVWNSRRSVGHNLQRHSLRRECEASLRRLKTETIDLYQVHWPNPDEDIEEGWATLAELQHEGKIRYLGVSNFSAAQMKRAQAIFPITSLQSRYSLLHREMELEVLPYAMRHKIGILAYSPMASGLLTGAMTRERVGKLPADDWRRTNPDFREPQLTHGLQLVRLLQGIARIHDCTPAKVAVAWVLHNPGVTGATVGGRSSEQVRGTADAGELRLTPRELAAIAAALEREFGGHRQPWTQGQRARTCSPSLRERSLVSR